MLNDAIRTWNCIVLILMSTLVLSMGGCSKLSEPQEGTLMIRFGDYPRSSNWEPDSDDMDIAEYEITISSSGGTFVQTHTAEGQSSAFVQDALQPGHYTIAIAGFNSAGDQIAVLQENSDVNNERVISAAVRRASITEVIAVLVPHVDNQEGSLEITQILFSDAEGNSFNDQLMQNNPRINLTLSHVANIDLNAAVDDQYVYALLDAERSQVSPIRSESGNASVFTIELPDDEHPGPDDIGTVSEPALTFTNLPAGWYLISIELQTDVIFDDGTLAVRNWKSAYTAKILDIKDSGAVKPTQGTVTVYDYMLETGSIELVFEEKMKQSFALSMSQDPQESVYIGTQVTFSSSYTSDAASYRWYVNGDVQIGKTEPTLSYSFNSEGIHSVVLSVREEGVWVGAIREVTVLGFDVGDTGPAGGTIFFVNPHVIRDGWKYLEAAPQQWDREADDWSDPTALWGPVDDTAGAAGTALGTGLDNTEAVVTAYPGEQYAAHLAYHAEIGGYADWYLPSSDELSKMHENLHDIADPVGGFSSGQYWSSSESDADNAYHLNFSDSSDGPAGKTEDYCVRPVRRF